MVGEVGVISLVSGVSLLVAVLLLFMQWQGVKTALDAFCLAALGVIVHLSVAQHLFGLLGFMEERLEPMEDDFVRSLEPSHMIVFLLLLLVPWVRVLVINSEKRTGLDQWVRRGAAVAILVAVPFLASLATNVGLR